MAEKDKEPLSTEDALKQWRAAERDHGDTP